MISVYVALTTKLQLPISDKGCSTTLARSIKFLKEIYLEINNNCHAFHLAFRVPDGESSRLDEFFEAHEKFMRETHFTDGDDEPRILIYTVTKCPELKNPLSPDEGTTRHTLFGINEVYRGPEGCAAHMAAGQAREALFAEFIDIVQTYMVSGLLAAPVIRHMQINFFITSTGVSAAIIVWISIKVKDSNSGELLQMMDQPQGNAFTFAQKGCERL